MSGSALTVWSLLGILSPPLCLSPSTRKSIWLGFITVVNELFPFINGPEGRWRGDWPPCWPSADHRVRTYQLPRTALVALQTPMFTASTPSDKSYIHSFFCLCYHRAFFLVLGRTVRIRHIMLRLLPTLFYPNKLSHSVLRNKEVSKTAKKTQQKQKQKTKKPKNVARMGYQEQSEKFLWKGTYYLLWNWVVYSRLKIIKSC